MDVTRRPKSSHLLLESLSWIPLLVPSHRSLQIIDKLTVSSRQRWMTELQNSCRGKKKKIEKTLGISCSIEYGACPFHNLLFANYLASECEHHLELLNLLSIWVTGVSQSKRFRFLDPTANDLPFTFGPTDFGLYFFFFFVGHQLLLSINNHCWLTSCYVSSLWWTISTLLKLLVPVTKHSNDAYTGRRLRSFQNLKIAEPIFALIVNIWKGARALKRQENTKMYTTRTSFACKSDAKVWETHLE